MEKILKGTGLIVLEVINSNPNGDPDNDSYPRQYENGIGYISAVSLKRKIRDLIDYKEGPVWKSLGIKDEDRYAILEQRGRDRKQIVKEIENNTFLKKYWDARVFGCTFLEDKNTGIIKTGVIQVGMGESVAPVEIDVITTTNKSGVEEGKDRGMAPGGLKVVRYGIYTIPFFINPTAAKNTNCTKEDIDVFLKVLPYAYSHTASYVRPNISMLHAWYIEHKNELGSVNETELIQALKPIAKAPTPEKRSDYEIPTDLPENLKSRVLMVKDLCA